MESPEMRQVHVTFETMLLEPILAPMAGGNDALASYGVQAFAHLLAERLEAS